MTTNKSASISEKLRSLVMDIALSALNWVDDHAPELPEDDEPLRFRDFVFFRLEGLALGIFNCAYRGSEAEIESVWAGEVPVMYMSERQLKALCFSANSVLQCSSCSWSGNFVSVFNDGVCPSCGGDAYVAQRGSHTPYAAGLLLSRVSPLK